MYRGKTPPVSQNENSTPNRSHEPERHIIELGLPRAADLFANRQVLYDLAAFVFSLALAYVFGWRAGDLVWSLWLSSLAIGCAIFLLWIINEVGKDLRLNFSRKSFFARLFAPFRTILLLVLPLTVLFALFYAGAHLFYSVFLNQSLPVIAGQRSPNWAMYADIFRNYWLFLPVALMREHRAIISIFRRNKSREGAQTAFWVERCKSLVKTHILIFALAFFSFGSSESFFTYAIVSAVYFFPWEIMTKPRDKNKPTIADMVKRASKMAAEEMANESVEKTKRAKKRR